MDDVERTEAERDPGTSFLVDPSQTLQSAVRWLQALEVHGWRERDRRNAAVILHALHVATPVADDDASHWLLEHVMHSSWARERAMCLRLLTELAPKN